MRPIRGKWYKCEVKGYPTFWGRFSGSDAADRLIVDDKTGCAWILSPEFVDLDNPLDYHPSEVAFKKAETQDDNSFSLAVTRVTDEIRDLLIEKNKSYGNAALDPVRVFSKADATEQLLVRIDDKISRIQRGTEFPSEDTITDLIGYLVLLKIAKNQNK